MVVFVYYKQAVKQINKQNSHMCSLSLAIPRSTTDWAKGTEDDP